MSKFKRTNRANTASKEVILVNKGDQALAAGALASNTTAFNIADGQLGVLSWDFDGTVALGSFITAGVTATNVRAVKVLQGTPKSGATHTVEPWEVDHKAVVSSGVIHRDNIRSVATVKYQVPTYSAHAVTDLPTIQAATEYGSYVYLYSVRNDRDWSRNDEVAYESFETPETLAGIQDTTGYVLGNLLYKFNSRSKLASLSNAAGVQRGNKDYVVVGVNTTGTVSGTAMGTITCAGTPTSVPIMNSRDLDGNMTTTYLNASAGLVSSFAKVIADQAGSAATDKITTSSTIEIIDPATNLLGTRASGTVTVTGNFTADDELTVGAVTYTLVASASSANEVTIGGTAAASLQNLFNAINGTGTGFGTGTVANPDVEAVGVTATVLTVAARQYGTAGNAVVLTEDTDDGNVFSVSGAGTLANGGENLMDAFIFVGLPQETAAYFDNIEQAQTTIFANLSGGLSAANTVAARIAPNEGTGQGTKWTIQSDDNYQLNVHTMQNQPRGEFFSKGITYIAPEKAYTSTIIDYYDYEETLTTRQVTPKQLVILLEATATCTTVATAVTNLASGEAIQTATTPTTTLTSLEAILGAWLDSAAAFSSFAYKGVAESTDIFA